MKISTLLVVSQILAAPFVSKALAASIGFSDFSSQKIEVSFSSLPFDFGPRPGPVIADGIAFVSGGGAFRTYPYQTPFPGGPDIQVCAERGCIMTDIELDYISVALPVPVTKVGAFLGIPNVPTTARAEFYSGLGLLGAVDISASAFEGVFAGWDAESQVITNVRFVDTEYQGFVLALSRFTYEIAAPVPLPAAIWLLGSALGVLGWARRKSFDSSRAL